MTTHISCWLKETPQIANRAIFSYFHPIKEISSLFKRSYEFTYDHERRKRAEIEKSLTIINNAICFNQGELIQFTYLAAEKHKNIKQYHKDEIHISKDILSNLVDDLLIFLNKKFFEVSYTNFEYMKLFFEGRSSEAPRMSLKGNFKIDQRDTIVSVFRDQAVDYQSDCEIEKNSGFDHILKKGKYYINNNIPGSFFKGEYDNPRLNYQNYKQQLPSNKFANKFISKFSSIADQVIDWRQCWVDCHRSKSEKSFYKSTLIIPMTLNNNKLSGTFKEKVNIQDVEKVIFGFLCFDHVDKDYFNEDTDVSLGYIFADLLSVYLFNRLVYTEISNTFKMVDDLLNNNYIDHLMNKLDNIQDMLSKTSLSFSDLSVNIKESTNNQLYKIDSILAKHSSHEFRS